MPKLLYLISEDWFFCSHFIERALAAKAAGFEVVVAAREHAHGAVIRNAGLRLIPMKIERRGVNPLVELKALFNILRIYRKERPDIVHHIALKPILYGSFIARLMKQPNIVNSPVGMGYVFTSNRWMARLLKPVVLAAIHWLINPRGSKVVFENKDDLTFFISGGLVHASDAVLIRGAGVNVDLFKPQVEPEGAPVVILVARMLWDKGIGEFVEAARQLHTEGISCRFLLVGAPDMGNPATISAEQLNKWNVEGDVEWIGHQNDIAAVLASSHIVCLPSYREGLPKALLEALAAGKPVVTTDVPGCREVVQNEVNGLLVPPREVPSLKNALQRLLTDPALRNDYGRKGRERAENEFSSQIIVNLTTNLYNDLWLKQKW